MYLYIRNKVATINLKYANLSAKYYVIKMVQNLKQKPHLKLENFQIFSHSRGSKCRVEVNHNREAVVVCARHVVK